MSKLNILPDNPEERARGRFPSWLHRRLPHGGQLPKTHELLQRFRLHTVCEEANCPNRLECFAKRTATFLALGKECTRSCGFCDIAFSKTPKPPEIDEPQRIAASVQELGLKHVVITMVARDDLPDQGASHMAAIVSEIRKLDTSTTIELLTSDFSGDLKNLDIVLDAKPDIFNHNIETVRSLSPRIRHKAQYHRTLSILHHAKTSKNAIFIKSGIMVGLGERPEEVLETIQDLFQSGCDIITIGQYLQSSSANLRVKEFVSPKQFELYADYGRSLGVCQMYCGPLVRSSYNAQLFAPQKPFHYN